MRNVCTALLALLLSFPAVASAETITLSYHDGTDEGYLNDLEVGDAEALRFSFEHPCMLQAVRLRVRGTGAAEVHVWGDNGGLQPDLDRELAPAQTVAPDETGWVTVSYEQVRIEPAQAFYVGIVRTEGGPQLLADTSEQEKYRSAIYTYVEDYGKALWVGLDGTYLVEADIEYVDVLETRWFQDVSEALGVNGIRGRVAWPDYDGDGDPDLCVSGGRLFRNDGAVFTDVTEEAGIGGFGTNGSVWADYDNDGDLDFYATVSSFESEDPERHDRLWRNEGDGTFTDVSLAAGAPFDDFPTEAAAWGDYDGDGFVDLYVANYEQPGEQLSIGTPDILWHNLGDGTFEDASEEAGIRLPFHQCGRGVAWADFDEDGDLDIYVSNYRLDRNFLFVNQGDGTFEEASQSHGIRGVAQGDPMYPSFGHSIGSAWGDLNGDGHLDLVVGNLAHPRFIEFSDKTMVYVSSGPPDWLFTDVREQSGVAYAETHSNATLADFDNDGLLDLHITSVYVSRWSYLYRNLGDMTFEDVNYPSGTVVENGWGSAWADYDRDGDMDLAASVLWRNDTGNVTSAGGWLGVRLEGTTSNRAAIGARVDVEAAGRTFVRQVEGGTGTGCQSDLQLHFGLGDAELVDRVQVRWPTGAVEAREGRLLPGQVLVLREGEVASADAHEAEPVPDAGATDDVASGVDVVDDSAAAEDVGTTDAGGSSSGGGGGGCTAGGRPSGASFLLLLAFALLGWRRMMWEPRAQAGAGR